MSESVTLTAVDEHQLSAYVVRPQGKPVAGLVVLQEIYGVNSHIRSVADAYAQDGFLAIAPALFDRIEPGLELGYEGPDRDKAMSLLPRLNVDKAVLDVAAALQYAKAETFAKVGVIGYCWGGLLSWLSATRLQPDAAVGYYAGGIGNFAQEKPHCPVMLHFGRQDTHIPAEQVEKVHAAHPQVEIFWYDAGHAFNAEPRSSYNPEAAKLARERSLTFLRSQLS